MTTDARRSFEPVRIEMWHCLAHKHPSILWPSGHGPFVDCVMACLVRGQLVAHDVLDIEWLVWD